MTSLVGREDPFAKTTAADVVDALWFKVKSIVNGGSIDVEEVTQLDTKISQILLHLRSFQNSLTSINSLPDELLASVFESTSYNGGRPDKLTQVCRRWRSVAIADPSLWSDIQISDNQRGITERTLTYLIRSKAFPISVRFGTLPVGPQVEKWGDLLSPHSSRIRELVLEALDMLPVLEDLSLPNLETFEISSSGYKGPPGLRPIFRGELNRLRHLRLAHFTSWPTELFQNLVTLHLSHQGHHVKVTMSAFIDLLEGSPLLERLYIVDHGPTNDGTASGRVASLPRLLDLYLNACHSQAILAHVKLPPAVKITVRDSLGYLSGLNDGLFDGDRVDLILAIPEDLCQFEVDYLQLSVGLEAVSMMATNQKGFYMRVSEDLGFFAGMDESELFRFTVESIMANLMFRSVTTLVLNIKIENDNVVPRETWEGILKYFSNLEHLTVGSPSTSNLLKALHPNAVGEAPICATLKKLSLATDPGEDTELWLTNLSSILEHRSTGGCPIDDLELELECLDSSLRPGIEVWMEALKDLGLKKIVLTSDKIRNV